ncbi:SCF apoptosis response protein 1, isoform CRA_d [Rattus norvegicus]|uniref:SCF apoptosis response protein 1, isoform CRA_d n=1 Tax=Rattus norvegicus TaxID=10116 RepID=A6JX89_RAT|nr:SCF apoptosis response protein 1, isoform CRA_d [Rattus norvegicus]
MRAGTFRPPRKYGSRRSEELSSAASPECPPRPHFRLPPLPRSRLPGPPGPQGTPQAQPHPAGAARSHAPAAACRERTQRARRRGRCSCVSGSGRSSSRTFYSQRQSLFSPYPICISSHKDPP